MLTAEVFNPLSCFRCTSVAGTLRQLLRGRVRGVRGQVRARGGDERVRQPRRSPRRQRLRQVQEGGGCGQGGQGSQQPLVRGASDIRRAHSSHGLQRGVL